MKSDTKFLMNLTDREILYVMRDELVKTNQGLVALDLELEHRLDEQQNIIHILQEELAETNQGLMALSMELEQRVERRTAELCNAQSELQRTNSDLLLLTMELDERVAQRTEELTNANAALSQEIAERQKAEAALRDSEMRVRTKLDSLLAPEGDIGTLDLADIMDIPAL